MLAMYLAVLDDRSSEEQFIDVYNTYKRLVYHTAYKIMGDSYLAEDVLQEVFLYVGTSEIPGQVTCYILIWEDAGVSCTIMGDGSLDELMKVAESIY